MFFRLLHFLIFSLRYWNIYAACTSEMIVNDLTSMNTALDCAETGLTASIFVSTSFTTSSTFSILTTPNEVTIYGSHSSPPLIAISFPARRLFFITNSKITFKDIRMSGSNSGGVFSIFASQLKIQNVTLAPTDSAQSFVTKGGAISANRSSVVLESAIINNWKVQNGGCIWMYDSNLLINLSTFLYNTASQSGGVLYAEGMGSFSVDVLQSDFTGNIAGDGGGAIYASGKSILNISDTILGNNTADLGSAVYFSSTNTASTLSLARSIIEFNTGDSTGAIYGIAASICLANITCANNKGKRDGNIYLSNILSVFHL
jgi:predicted outer membrane repeat protein